MTDTHSISGAEALRSLLGRQNQLDAVSDREWAAAAGIIVRKLLISAGQTTESIALLRAGVGDDIFLPQLKSLTHHQARLLARRLDRNVPDFEVSSAPAAIAHIRLLLKTAMSGPESDDPASGTGPGQDVWAAAPARLSADDGGKEADTPDGQTPAGPDGADRTPAAGTSSYFGRRSFRS